MIGSTFSQMANAEKLTPQQLQQAMKDGVLPSYIGIPLLQEKVKQSQSAQAMAGGQQKPPTVAQQVMQQLGAQQGVEGLPSNLPVEGMAGGGIVAFADGGLYDDEDTDEDRIDSSRQQELDDLMGEYAKTFQGGIGSLPAAEGAPQGKESATDFVARIMHKESRGQRYGKNGELLTSEKGAQGEMQVMPGTSRDPGFGVKPARDSSPDELARVGRDYAQTLLARYGDPKLAAIAYNMGPGATDKWLAAGADMSKLPRETQGYVKGFAGGGDVADDYSTIEGLEPSDLYAEAIKRAKAAREKEAAVEEAPVKPGLWPYNAPEAGKFSYEDAAKFDARKKEEEPKASPTSKPGITYAPNAGIGNVTPTRYVPKEEPQSEYQKQMSNVGGFFGDVGKGALSGIATLGKHIVSAPGYGFSSQGRTEEAAPAAKQKPQDFTQFDAATARYMNDRDQARLAAARQNELGIRADAAKAAAAQPDKAEAAKVLEAAKPADWRQEFQDIFKKREENLAKQREQDKYTALLQAGLGMMGGQSPNALANIAAGGAEGLKALAASRAAGTAEENALLSGRLGLAKVGAAADQAAAAQQLRKDISAAQTNLRQQAIDETAKKDLAGQLGQMEKLATSRYLAKMKAQIIPGQEGVIEAQALEALRADPAYRQLYKKVHGFDPMSDTSGTGGGKMSADRAGQFKVER